MADKKQSFQEQHGGFADAVEDFLMGGLDLVVPHARREPLNPMAYVKDVNEWFAPSAQMALDEASGEANYPAWAYALASLPVVGKVAKPAAKVAAKTAGKSANKLKPLTKYEQAEIAIKNNPMNDDYHRGIRSEKDVKSWEEAMNDGESFVYGDFDISDAKKALESGKVIVYSSRPFELGSFVSTSKNMAKDYAGNSGKIYEKEIDLNDVAWLDGDEGQIVRIR